MYIWHVQPLLEFPTVLKRVFLDWGIKTRVPSENPCIHEMNMQTPPRQDWMRQDKSPFCCKPSLHRCDHLNKLLKRLPYQHVSKSHYLSFPIFFFSPVSLAVFDHLFHMWHKFQHTLYKKEVLAPGTGHCRGLCSYQQPGHMADWWGTQGGTHWDRMR